MGPIRLLKSNKHLSLVLGAIVFVFLFVEWQLSTLQTQKTDLIVKNDASAVIAHEATKQFLPVVLYNRIPKSGSTTFTHLLYDVAKLNQIYVLHINTSGNSLKISLSDQISLAWNMTHWDAMKPAFYHGHFCYYSFSRFGLQNPYYINMLREPLDRLVSHYYFLRYGDDYRKGLKRMRQGDTTTFDECLDQGGRECQPKQLWLQIPLLCGQTAECWKIGSTWALEEAKHNVMSSYTLVGVTERMDEFVDVLEKILPQMFHGIADKYKEGTQSHIRKTLHKEPLSEKSLAHMKNSKIYKMERELYDFTVKHFDYLKKQLSDSNGKLFPTGKRFRYEKVYGPKGAIIK